MPGRLPDKVKQEAKKLGLTQEDLILPYWSKKRILSDRMQVDHIVEMQVTPIGREDEFDNMANYRLMEASENASVGSELAANIKKMRDALKALGGNVWLQCDLTFDRVATSGNKTPTTWTEEELKRGEQVEAYKRLKPGSPKP